MTFPVTPCYPAANTPSSGVTTTFTVAGPVALFDPAVIGTHTTVASWDISSPTGTDDRVVNADSITENLALTETYTVVLTFAAGEETLVTSLNCNTDGITALDVVALTELVSIYAYGNALTTVDVSGLASLEILSCYSNSGMTTLTLTGATALTHLSCSACSLSALDITASTGLTYLSCGSNSLTSLDFTGQTSLTYVECVNNSLTTMTAVTDMTALVTFYCYGNSLTTVDVSGLASLDTLFCYSNSGMTTADISGTTALADFRTQGNALSAAVIDAILIQGDIDWTASGLTIQYDIMAGDTDHDSARSSAATTAIANMSGEGWTRLGTY